MSLAQELAARGDAVAVFLDPERRRSELRADLFAAARPAGPRPSTHDDGAPAPGHTVDPYALHTRPTILRRLAALLADELPARLDRLVAADRADTPLVTAVALHTGLPFALAGKGPGTEGGTGLLGEVHRGERITVLTTVTAGGRSALRTAELARRHGAEVASVLTVIDRDEGAVARLAAAGHRLRALFTDGTAP
ncbi:orotate phosphoribosyltransferase [Streptomyces sp. NPDC049597]|uniref:orotate phosphoribosyltransferase n=1 Tax=Streptomyces sp. NPDC049597 TaxID=3155276 RepID=UPI0034275B6B